MIKGVIGGTSLSTWLADQSKLLVAFVERFIASEHHCALPDDGRVWVAIASQKGVIEGCKAYQCPECEQYHAVRPAANLFADDET